MWLALLFALVALTGWPAPADAAKACYTVPCLTCATPSATNPQALPSLSHPVWVCAQLEPCGAQMHLDPWACGFPPRAPKYQWIPHCTPDATQPGCWPPAGCTDGVCTSFDQARQEVWPAKRCWGLGEADQGTCPDCPAPPPPLQIAVQPACTMSTQGFFSATTKEKLGKASALTNLAAAGTALIAQGQAHPGLRTALNSAALLQAAVAAGLAVLHADPADPNYTVIAVAVPQPITPIVPVAGVTSTRQANTFNRWQRNQALMTALMTAMNQTLDRAQGAIDAGDAVWFNRQVQTYNALQLRLADALDKDVTHRRAFAALPPKAWPVAFAVALVKPQLLTVLTNVGTRLRQL